MSLLQRLGLSAKERDDLGSLAGKLKSVSDFLDDAIKAFEKVGFPQAIAEAAPWAGAFAESFAEAVPPVRFVVTLFRKLTEERDPEVLAYLACTLAYQRSLEQAFGVIGSPKGTHAPAQLHKQLENVRPAEVIGFGTFSFASALQHPFVTYSDTLLTEAMQLVGYSGKEVTKVVGEVHVRFVGNLKTIVSHGDTREKFSPFTTRMELNTREDRAYSALFGHADYQRRLFEEVPVLGREPFSLAHVYVETDCGLLEWGAIRRGSEEAGTGHGRERKPVDPFSEDHGGRAPLVGQVLELIGDPNFREAIVVQGVAGSGKSTFTLRLCSELIRQGLRPIRVRLRDLRLDRHVSEALPRAVRFSEEGGPTTEVQAATADELFLGGTIFNESVRLGRADICPWVIILDGWDEVSISAAEGFKVRIDRLLNEVRGEYLQRSGSPIRVILTGRPSTAVTESTFLRSETPILTLRPLSPTAVGTLVEKLSVALKTRPLPIQHAYDWRIDDPTRFQPVMEQYEHDFNSRSGSMEVLGLPLLAHLAVRLMSQWHGDLRVLVTNPTTLYRKLVDLTCERAGRPADMHEDAAGRAYLEGIELRRLLRETAAAMTAYGQESIPFVELSRRLSERAERLVRRADQAHDEHVLTSLMVSYFFKGGHTHLGAEFSHKSFREYLFAEQIIETLKEYALKAGPLQPERQAYWEDFEEHDPRHDLSEKLARLLAPQWLSGEVAAHIESLVEWEISRTPDAEEETLGRPTVPLTLQDWFRARDGLADLWDWWGEGVHLRPQADIRRRGFTGFDVKPLAVELVDWSAPQNLEYNDPIPAPARVTTIDAHMGDALFRLCALTHYHIAVQSGWLRSRLGDTEEIDPAALWKGVSPIGDGPRRCQSRVEQEQESWVFFAPSGRSTGYFQNYISRINAAGWRPASAFPFGTRARGVDLRGVEMSMTIPAEFYAVDPGSKFQVDWTYANLCEAILPSVFLFGRFTGIFSEKLRSVLPLCAANISAGNFNGAQLRGAVFAERSDLSSARFIGTDLQFAVFEDADLGRAWFDDADLSSSRFQNVDASAASFRAADLSRAYFYDVKFSNADLTDAKLDGAVFKRSHLRGARGLTREQILVAHVDSDTILHDELLPLPHFESPEGASPE